MGRAEGERAVLIRLGTRKFGPPGAGVLSLLHAVNDPERLAVPCPAGCPPALPPLNERRK